MTTKATKRAEIHGQFITDKVEIVETVDGDFMVLVNGVQWGGNRDLSGAGDATFPTIEAACKAYCNAQD